MSADDGIEGRKQVRRGRRNLIEERIDTYRFRLRRRSQVEVTVEEVLREVLHGS